MGMRAGCIALVVTAAVFAGVSPRETAAANARRFAAEHGGAATRMAECILTLMPG